ncbi:hypothetical protein J5N97_006542 [Dioscorea zingiberensis]|uniref:Subtilisin-like protease n=1 Tax=Dioscorea zingiberensis TaxID=325984 RepID=A0A9D5HTP6_9LILI|nr:hypothetical protein J5N97_006542 [Dioscorea zingiberensis]
MVANASIFGYAEGIAKGGAPRARVAAYKVCWDIGCATADIMKGFDTAIHDGVDVISVSLGGTPGPYLQDGTSISSFHAMSKGIIVVCSAGNDGPTAGSVTNVSPWVITVAASTLDREFPSYISFNNQHIKGQSLSSTVLPEKYYPMINAADAALSNDTAVDAGICLLGTLDPKKVQGKIVVCLRGSNARVQKGEAVLQSGGIGMVLANDEMSGDEIIADPHILPATHITYSDGLKLYSYLNSTKSPLGYISIPKTKINTKPSPTMAAFSSQGPNTVSFEVLKPDITAPGVNVLAAYTKTIGPIPDKFDTRRVPYIIMSGTSMSCPHISGIAALIKAVHPSWSPSRIKSAIMTSAQILDNTGSLIKDSVLNISTPYNYGSGHVAPNRAMNPGLVYDLSITDYLSYLCSFGYNSTYLKAFLGETYSCPKVPMKMEDLNYPSISVPHLVKSNITVTRTLTNVGRPSTYKVAVMEPKDVSVTVKPTVLKFSKKGQKQKYTVTFETTKKGLEGPRFGRIVWSDGKHIVGTPIAAEFLQP